jgi:sulfoxide reductase heme-binding subunit YedZ
MPLQLQPPWRDRRGRLIPIKAVVLALCCMPGLWIIGEWLAGNLGPRTLNAAILETGLWTVRFFLITLLVTPLRALFNWPRALLVRRMLGITTLVYGVAHLLLYVADQKYNLITVASEIVQRFYLTIGFIALLGFAALGATSTDAAIRRMGAWWKRLHRAGYVIGVLALLHFFIQSKADVSEATYAAGLFLWLLAWRAVPETIRTRFATLCALLVLAPLLTMAVEFAWYALATRIPAQRVLMANFSIDAGLRPAHWVFVTALILTAAVAAWTFRRRQPTAPVPYPPSART